LNQHFLWATDLFENTIRVFKTGKAQTLASPTTTLGNISSLPMICKVPAQNFTFRSVRQLYMVLNGVAWPDPNKFWLVVVKPLTDFTIAQMRALKIYSRSEEAYPNRALI
jgi:hypothetical protein